MELSAKAKRNIEATSKVEIVSMNMPFLLLVLEFAREKTLNDQQVHLFVERLMLEGKKNRVLSTENFDEIMTTFRAKKKHVSQKPEAKEEPKEKSEKTEGAE